MEKMDIDMVVTIPDTPDRMVGRGSIRREAKRNQHSPDVAGHQREEYRSYLSSRTRRVPEIEGHIEPRMELRGDSDTQTGGVHRLRASRSNALFRKTVDEKGKGKSISTDSRADPPALVQKNPVLNLSKHNGHTNFTAVTSSRSLPSEDRKELRPVHALLGARNSCKLTGSSNNGKEKIECGSPLEGNHNSLKMAWNSNKGKEKVHCDSVSNREIIDLSSDPRQKRGTKRLVRNGCISPHKIAARARQDADQYPTSSLGTMCDWTVQQQMAAAENRSSIGISEIVSENDTDLFHTEQDANPFPRSSRATMCDWSIQHQMAAAENRSSIGISGIVSENDTDLFHTEQDANPFPRSSRATMCDWSIQHQMAAVEKRSSIGISEIVSENDINRGARGKRPEISPIRMVRRDTDGSDGWKSTRNRTLSIGHNSSQHHENSRRNESSSGRICSSVTRLDVHETNGIDRESRQQRRKYEHNIGHGINGRDGNDTRGVSNSESGFDTREPSAVDGESRRQQRKYDHEINGRDGNGTREVSSSESGFEVRETSAGIGEARQRRRRNGFTSAAALYEPEVIVVGTSREPSSPRPTRIQNLHRLGTQVLEINDSSPEVRVSRSRGTRHVENNMNARQIEADEILARELQEQLYREAPLVTDELTDENIARMLEQEENSIRAFSSHASGRSTRNSNHNSANTRPRNRLRRRMLMLERRSSNPLLPPRASARVPSGRGQRLGGAPAALRRALNLRFPNDMVLESRLDFLEELENVIGHSSLLHTDRDFTEGDYEMLLRLDENNHRHGGASSHHINNLPQSTVQTENFEETCVICLETPTVGDTIRHLPCLHKFHKDCIDEWLGRNASCPVCKSSVT